MKKSLILFLSASPKNASQQEKDTPFVETFKEIRERIEDAKFSKHFITEREHRISVDELEELLLYKYKPQIVQFFGHGEKRFLLLEDEQGNIEEAKLKPFSKLFKYVNDDEDDPWKKIRLVILVACHSKEIAKAISENVECTIGMTNEIGVDSGRKFAKSFYFHLCSGRSVQLSFDYACNQMGFTSLIDQNRPRLVPMEGCDPRKMYFVPKKGRGVYYIAQRTKDEIEEILDDLMPMETNEALSTIEQALASLDREFTGREFKIIQCLLESLGYFFESLRRMTQDNDFKGANELLLKASDGFDKIDLGELQIVTTGLAFYCSGVNELLKQNFDKAMSVYATAKDFLKKSSRFGRKYQRFIDFMEPELLFISGVRARLNNDFDNAKILIDQASIAAEKVAKEYYVDGDLFYDKFTGLSYLYKTVFAFWQTTNDFLIFAFDKILANQEMMLNATKAQEFLERSDQGDFMSRILINQSKGLGNILQSLRDLSKIVLIFA